MPSHEDKIDRFVESCASRLGNLADIEQQSEDKRRYAICIEHHGIVVNTVLMFFFGRKAPSGELAPKMLKSANRCEIRFGCQQLHKMPIESYRIDYFTQAFRELERHMHSGRGGDAKLIQNDDFLAMRISREKGISLQRPDWAIDRAGRLFGTQAYKDTVKLIEYASLPV